MATQVNSTPLPSVPEVFGVRLPQPADCLTSIDFDLVPHKPPPGVKLYDEEIEEIEDSESEDEEDDDEDMEPASIPKPLVTTTASFTPVPMAVDQVIREEAPFPISAIQTPSDLDMIGTPMGGTVDADNGSDAAEEEEGLFAGGDDEEEESDAMEEVQAEPGATNGVKRKLVEEDDYD